MRYLYDADALIDYLTDVAGARTRFPALLPDGLALCSVTSIERYTGVYGARDTQQAEQDLRAVLGAMTVLEVNRRVVRRTARVCQHLLAHRLTIKQRAYDLIVAATALEYGLTLVTSNTRDYHDVPGVALFNPRTAF